MGQEPLPEDAADAPAPAKVDRRIGRRPDNAFPVGNNLNPWGRKGKPKPPPASPEDGTPPAVEPPAPPPPPSAPSPPEPGDAPAPTGVRRIDAQMDLTYWRKRRDAHARELAKAQAEVVRLERQLGVSEPVSDQPQAPPGPPPADGPAVTVAEVEALERAGVRFELREVRSEDGKLVDLRLLSYPPGHDLDPRSAELVERFFWRFVPGSRAGRAYVAAYVERLARLATQ